MADIQVPTKRTDLNTSEAVKVAAQLLEKNFTTSFSKFLEGKHLYQKVKLEYEAIVTAVLQHTEKAYQEAFMRTIYAMTRHLLLATEDTAVSGGADFGMYKGRLQINIYVFNTKFYCGTCDAREPAKPILVVDLVQNIEDSGKVAVATGLSQGYQLWLIAYQCQNCCQGVTQSILLRREGWDVYIDGRSPYEKLAMPAFIPKAERKWYRDALIAENSSKTLAALFYLRTFIEQFARRQTKISGRMTGTEIMNAYNELLPEPQRSMMPSLREWYDKLSECIHGAKEDAVLFEKAREEIVHHFDIRRVHRIPEVP